MRNAKKIDDRVTVGGVPTREDLTQLRELGYKTLIDVREDDEKFSGQVERHARELGLIYIAVPISRHGIDIDDVIRFYHMIYEKGSAPIYAFSRFGKKPLAFLLLFEAVANGDTIARVFERAGRIGLDLRGDLTLQEFLVKFVNDGCFGDVVDAVRAVRPDLFRKDKSPTPTLRSGRDESARDARLGIVRQKGCTIWLTGLPSSGKSSTAFSLERKLLDLGRLAYVLDSDAIRPGLNKDLGFTAADREENIRRVGEVAKLLADAGVMTIVSFISPYRRDRAFVRDLHGSAGLGFVEVYASAPVEVCESRDDRGLYKRAREGELKGFTGVDDPYEPPIKPEILINTAKRTTEDVTAQILDELLSRGLLGS